MKHRIGLTVTDPNHPMVSKRKETIQKTVRVSGEDREKAINSAIAHYKRKGYKVHDHHYIGTVNEDVEQIDEVGDTAKGQKLLQRVNKRAVDRLTSKRADTDPAYAKKAQQTHLAADERLKEESDVYAKSEENKRSADAAKKQGDMMAHHLHMADYHDNLAQWNAEKGRHSVADNHAEKSEQHHAQAMKLKEEVEQVDELSKNTLRKYVNKARSDRMDALHSNYRNTDDDYEAAKKDNERVEKRDRGINLARAKINKFGKSGNTITKVKATEEVEQVDELRTSTLLRYQTKANKALIGGDRNKEEKRIKSIQKANYKIQTRHRVKEDIELDEADAFPVGHDGQQVKSQVKSTRQSAETRARSTAAQAVNKSKTDAAMKEELENVDEAWTQGNRNPQKGIKVGHKVRSYDFPGMHDDHYIEGHVVGETPHSYHIRVNRVVRSGKEIPTPSHMTHVEAPKGKGMMSNAYAVHKIIAKQNEVSAAPEPAKGGARTFANLRGKK